ncbi:MAG: LysR substrate-binding domain-containing protein [Gammaproteobacteria bacterium]|nr:LysR substrate-binding domain-containing protein [Gammaproteobacteria bacterium]
MKLQQLRYICEVARRGLNVTTAAERLFTAQSGISTQIRLLEEELNTQIFERHGKRLTGVTPAGETIIAMAERILTEAENIRQVAQQLNDESKGTLSIATTHTQAYHALPEVIARFSEKYPDVKLRIHQGDAQQIHEMLLNRTADVAVTTVSRNMPNELVMLPYREWHLAVITPPDHPLTQEPVLSLEALAKYPLITYDHEVAGRNAINQAFTDAGLLTNIALTALDSDIIKKYVKLGMGVGLIAETALEESGETELAVLSAEHLFRPSTSCICVHRGRHLRGFVYSFITQITPQLSDDAVEGILRWESTKGDNSSAE